MDDLTEVKLKVDGKASDGFLVRRLSLKEGICRIPTAELVLCTKGDAIRMDELETYVEKAAALEISRTDAATERRTTRWFAGMVTSVEGCGVVAQSRSGEVFEYRMTIQPKLVNLCYSRSGRNFIQATAMEAVRTILEGFDVQYQDGGLPESANLKQDFFQRQESDYAFLMRILASCGLSYTFRTPDQTGRVTPPMMHVGTGNALPAASDFLCDGKTVLPSAFSCAALRTDGGYCKMDSWRMRKSIGVDSLEVGFTNRAGADVRGAAGSGDARRMRMDEALFADAQQGEIDRLVEEHLRKMRVPTAGWTGTTQCLEALPGNLLKVNHFYGRNSTEVVEALVFSSTLDCTLPILPGESLFGENDKVSMRIDLRCLAGTAVPETVSSAAETVSGAGVPSAALFVKQAVVTDLSGNVTDKTKNAAVKFVKDKGYVFNAKVNPEDEPNKKFEVNFTQPVGGLGQGLFRMPRVGDRILVLGVPTAVKDQPDTYYLLGYLPGNAMPFSTSKELERRATDETYKTALPEEMMALRFRTTGEKKGEDLENKMGIRRAKLLNKCSELAFYNTHDFGEDAKYEDSKDRKVLANLQSTGNMQLSANHNLEMSARNLTFKGTGWAGEWVESEGKWSLPDAKVSFDDINRFVVEAKNSITFKVRHNSITIDQRGVSINATRWTDMSGPIDASISLNPLTGVAVSGLNCMINGYLSASISDFIGAGATFSSGAASISGGKVTQKTLSFANATKSTAFGVASFAPQICEWAGRKDVAKWSKMGLGVFKTFGVDGAFRWYGMHRKRNAGTLEAADVFDAAFRYVQALIDTAVMVIGANEEWAKWLSQPAAGQGGKDNPLTVRDAFVLAALCTKAACWGIALATETASSVLKARKNPWKSATTALEYSGFSAKCGDVDFLAQAFNQYNDAFSDRVNNELGELQGRVHALENPDDPA